jgi:hypothetical protein
MNIKRKTTGLFLRATVAAAILGATFAASASASPAWRFNGTELAGSETIVGEAILSSLTVPGLTTSCKKMHYEMTISNSGGVGQGELQTLTFKTCFTSSEFCTVKSIKAEKLPWPVHLVTVATKNYVVIEAIKISIVYAGAECALGGVQVNATGSAAGLYSNPSETFALNAASSTAAGTTLKALGATIEWNGTFTTDATGAHSGEALTVS